MLILFFNGKPGRFGAGVRVLLYLDSLRDPSVTCGNGLPSPPLRGHLPRRGRQGGRGNGLPRRCAPRNDKPILAPPVGELARREP